MPQRVLIVDDEADIRELLEITLTRMNLETCSASDLTQAHKHLQAASFDLCLTDMRLPDGDGLSLVKFIQDHCPATPVAVITAYGSTDTAIHALKSGAFDFVSKPVDLQKLRALVETALKLNAQVIESDQTCINQNIIGNTPAIKYLRKQILKVSRSQAPVFISGESGSGKELVAKAIHYEGPRKEGPFIAINCGAIPGELMESEFFGHRKGSFTGADHDKTGFFQQAHGGSLFLDEIADLPLHMQVKLLRAIQEKSIRPIGMAQEIAVDVRIISATHKDLEAAVNQGNLRQDLYYRINVIQLQVPSLRDRKEDIPLLTAHILKQLSSASKYGCISLSDHAMSQLLAYHFPGNVRELENILMRGHALAEANVIEELNLPSRALEQTATASTETDTSPTLPLSIATVSSVEPVTAFSLEKHLEDIEKQAIEAALHATRWNKTAAARKLGMSFRSFRYPSQKTGTGIKPGSVAWAFTGIICKTVIDELYSYSSGLNCQSIYLLGS
jgi:two-component system, NtrC family, response regulator PilR